MSPRNRPDRRPEADPPNALRLIATRRRGGAQRLIHWMAAAACMLLVTFVLLVLEAMERADRPDWLNAALDRHRALSAAPAGDLDDRAALVSLGGTQALVPDLASGELTLTSLSDFAIDRETNGLAAHYRGAGGCKLTLFLMPDLKVGLSPQLNRRQGSGYSGFEWRHGNVGYVLLAEEMEEKHLGLIAQTIFDASRKPRPLDAEERTALADSRGQAAPCNA